jgi:hypothetical protein
VERALIGLHGRGAPFEEASKAEAPRGRPDPSGPSRLHDQPEDWEAAAHARPGGGSYAAPMAVGGAGITAAPGLQARMLALPDIVCKAADGGLFMVELG